MKRMTMIYVAILTLATMTSKKIIINEPHAKNIELVLQIIFLNTVPIAFFRIIA